MLLYKIRLRRGIRAAEAADASAMTPLVEVDAVPPGNWSVSTTATAPFTSKPWDRRARAAGLLIRIRTFTERGRRVMRIQVRRMTSPADAMSALSSYDALLYKSHKAVIGRKPLSQRVVQLSPASVPGVAALVGFETVLVRGFRGMALATVHGSDVVSVVAYGPTGTWTWQAIAAAAREQLALLRSTSTA